MKLRKQKNMKDGYDRKIMSQQQQQQDIITVGEPKVHYVKAAATAAETTLVDTNLAKEINDLVIWFKANPDKVSEFITKLSTIIASIINVNPSPASSSTTTRSSW